IRSRKLQLKSAAKADQIAGDLEVWHAHAGPIYGVPYDLRRTERADRRLAAWCVGEPYKPPPLHWLELSHELRAYADAIRHMKKTSAKHRPRDVMFTERALSLTYTFLEYAKAPLWDFTARLVIGHHVENGRDSVKKAVMAALKRNPNGFLEGRIARALQRQHRGTHALSDRRRQSRR